MKGAPRSLALLLGLSLAGIACQDREQKQAETSAREALGVADGNKEVTTSDKKQDVLVKETTQVIDAKTGKTLSEKSHVTPITVETKINKKVDVSVGDSKTGTEPK